MPTPAHRFAIACSVALACALAALLFTTAPALAATTNVYQSQLDGSTTPQSSFYAGGVATDSAGNVYVADYNSGFVDKFDSSGAYVSQLDGSTTPQNSFFARALAVDGSDNVYVADQSNAVVDKFDSSGAYVSQFDGSTTPQSSFFPGALAIDGSGNVYVADYNSGFVDKFDSSGNYVSQFDGSTTPQSSFFPGALAIDSAGNVYVADYNSGFVDKFDSSGNYVSQFDGSTTPQSSFVPGALAIDGSGNVYVADQSNAVVDRFDSSGAYVSQFDGSTTPQSSFYPQSLAVDASGDVYVGDANNGVVDVFGAPVVVPDVTTGAASNVQPPTATLNGTVNPGGVQLTDCHFDYTNDADFQAHGFSGPGAQSAACVPAAGSIPADSSDHAVSADIGGLDPGTYHFRLSASNANGATVGHDQPFDATKPPTIDSVLAVNVASTSADLRAKINPNFADTTYHFEYVDDAQFTIDGFASATSVPQPDADIGSGLTDQTVIQHLSGLSPSTTYHFRVVATNAAGPPVEGPDATFETTAPPTPSGSDGCPNASLRAQSDTNPTTGQPYSAGLPDCRGYEMVTPLDKQDHDAITPGSQNFLSVSPDGARAAWTSQGNYAGNENTNTYTAPQNPYIGERTATGWLTHSGLAPRSMVEWPSLVGSSAQNQLTLLSADLARQAGCGSQVTGHGPLANLTCALRQPDGSWLSTPQYTAPTVNSFSSFQVSGSSSDLSHLFVQAHTGGANAHLLPDDPYGCTTQGDCSNGSIYEISGFGTSAPALRLTSVDSNDNLLPGQAWQILGGGICRTQSSPAEGPPSYQAVSADGSIAYFTVCSLSGLGTIYARTNGSTTTAISNPSPAECTTCDPTPQTAVYQGASRDGAKAFFTTSQQLLNADTDTTADLYQYDFSRPDTHHLTQISGGGNGDPTPGSGADVQGVVRTSSDGSHVYFVARGVLTTLPNGVGDTAVPGSNNLYAYDTGTNDTKFVATLSAGDSNLWSVVTSGTPGSASQGADGHWAQTTPDGRYLAFASLAQLTPDDTDNAVDVYRYDFQTGALIRISVGEPGFAASDNGNTPGMDALIAPLPLSTTGAQANINTIGRAISDDGGTIVFSTREPLQADDVNGGGAGSCRFIGGGVAATTAGCDVYRWQDGAVRMISDGQDPNGATNPVLSSDGSAVFFQTQTRLVGQDTDNLGDVYVARVGGGFPYTPAATPCADNGGCQGPASQTAPASATPGSSSFSGPGNQTTPKPKKKPHKKKHHRHHKKSHKRATHNNRGGSK